MNPDIGKVKVITACKICHYIHVIPTTWEISYSKL